MDQSSPGIRQLAQQVVPAPAPGVIYTQPGAQNQRSVIKHIALCNLTSTAQPFHMCVAKAGDAPAHKNFVFLGHSVPADESEFFDWGHGGMAIEPGGTIQAWADAADVLCITISGIEYF